MLVRKSLALPASRGGGKDCEADRKGDRIRGVVEYRIADGMENPQAKPHPQVIPVLYVTTAKHTYTNDDI